MNKEFENSGEENAKWQDPTKEVKEEEKEGAMGKIEQFLQKLPGGKFLLPAAAVISLWGGSIEESHGGAREYLSFKNGVKAMVSLAIMDEFDAGATLKPDGNYIIKEREERPTSNTSIRDLVKQSGEKIKLPQDPGKFIEGDLTAFKKELGQVCKDKKLVGILGNEMTNFANETFPNGFGKEGFVTKGEERVNAEEALFQDVEAEVAEHMAQVREKIYSIKDSSRAKVTGIVLREYCDLVGDAVRFNMARDQEK